MDSFFQHILHKELGADHRLSHTQSVGGGCIHHGVKLVTTKGVFFLKWNKGLPGDMFAAEVRGLKLLRSKNTIRIPQAIAYGEADGFDYLLMEFLEPGVRRVDFWEHFGNKLAHLHLMKEETRFGLDHDNYIGSLGQENSWKGDWIEFFIERRLRPQIMLAEKSSLLDENFAKRFDQLFAKLSELLPEEHPSLLHGDLWSGNFLVGEDGSACLIDPAVYYGNREIELSFTHLFGGFDQQFYEAYHNTFPIQNGFTQRVDLYNLYPLLVHLNLFGSSYLSGIKRTLDQYL